MLKRTIADLTIDHVIADFDDLADRVGAEHMRKGYWPAVSPGSHSEIERSIHCDRVHPNQDFVRLRHGARHLGQFQRFGAAETAHHDGFHGAFHGAIA
jgi:hypothetical protein